MKHLTMKIDQQDARKKMKKNNHRQLHDSQNIIVVDFLFIDSPIVGVCNCSMFCCTLLYVHSSIVIILMGKRELVAFLNLSSWCLIMVERLFLAVPRGCLRFVIVVFPDHTHLLLFIVKQPSLTSSASDYTARKGHLLLHYKVIPPPTHTHILLDVMHKKIICLMF